MRDPLLVVYGVTEGVSAHALLRGQLTWLQARGWRIHLSVNPDHHAHAASRREGVTLEAIPMARQPSPRSDLRALVRWIRMLRQIGPSVTNVSTPKAGLIGGLAARLTGVPRRLYVVRGLRLEGATGLMSTLLWASERLAIACATDVIFVSESLAAEARRRHLLKRQGWIVGPGSSNGVPIGEIRRTAYSANLSTIQRITGIDPTCVIVGYVGRICIDKGVDTLLNAFSALPPEDRAQLLLIGPVEEPHLVQSIEALHPHVLHIPWTNDTWAYYRAIDILCLPTHREGFPNVVLEAAAVGVPTITTRATGAVDSVLHQHTGLLVDVGDVRQLGEAIQRLIRDPALRKRLGRQASEHAESFNPQHIWTGLEAIMQGVSATHVRAI